MAVNLPPGYTLDSAPPPSLPPGYTLDAPEGKSLEGFAKNAVSDVGDIATGGASMVKKGAYDLPSSLTSSLAQKVGDIFTGDSGQTPIGKEVTDFANNSPELGKQMVAPIAHPIEYGYQHPVSQAINVATGLEGMAKGAEFMAPQLARTARNQTMKSLGGSMSQIKQMAKAGGLDESAAFARDKGAADIFSTSLGREDLINKLSAKNGAELGGLRTEGGASPLTQADLESKVLTDPKIQKYLGNGLQSGQKANVSQALDDIARVSGQNPTFASRANAATDLNQSAAGNKIYQPTTAATDVANILSRENNQGLGAVLGPKKAAQEIAARKEFSNLQPIKHLQEYGELKEMRGQPGIKNAIVSFMPEGIANRTAAKTASALSTGAKFVGGMASDTAMEGGIGASLMNTIATNPQSLGKYAGPLQQAAQTGGSQGVAAMHYVLSLSHPDYNQMTQDRSQ